MELYICCPRVEDSTIILCISKEVNASKTLKVLFLFKTLIIITAERTKTILSHLYRYKALTSSLVGDLEDTGEG